jgi:2'-5' RNA ligase
MSTVVRAFVALRVPASPPLGEVLGELRSLGRPVRAVAAENLHLTLKFLGNTDENWIPDIARLLADVAAGTSAFAVTLCGLGVFPKLSRPSVIWTGMTPPEPVVRLARDVEVALVTFGFAPETRTFQPHVTLARIKSRPPQELPTLLDRQAETVFATFPVDELVLMQSELTPRGSRYTPLSTARLHASGGRESTDAPNNPV